MMLSRYMTRLILTSKSGQILTSVVGNWLERIAMSGSLVAGLDTTNDVIKVYDTSNSNQQVGADIDLGSGRLAKDCDVRFTCGRH